MMTSWRSLDIDIETYSGTDLAKGGVYRYAEDPDFKILLFGYAPDGGEVKVVDLTRGETIPPGVIAALTDGRVKKWAHNANFERVCLSTWLKRHHPETLKGRKFLNPEEWRCSMIWAAYLGLPLSLAGVGAVLGLEEQKLTEGKKLIWRFCRPGRNYRDPKVDPEGWELFKAYNARDVQVERDITARLMKFPVPDSVWEEYAQDQEINDRGVRVDLELVDAAISLDAQVRAELMAASKQITALENPNSVLQLKTWLAETGTETDTLDKKRVAELLKDAPEDVKKVLTYRQQLARSSVKKYQAMANSVCADGRARGMFQFYGAARTGRWAGRRIQLQNLRQNHLDNLAGARELVRTGDLAGVRERYSDVPDTLSQLIRTAFIPTPGRRFIVADFSAIEARVLAWLAGESWRSRVFAEGGDIYCASASQMFKVPVEKHGINAHLRQKGKIAELALGYGGSTGALKAMGALEMGLKEEELKPLVDAWRAANPHIVEFWWDVDRAAMTALKRREFTRAGGIGFSAESGMLFVILPNGRRLAYVKPKIGLNKFDAEAITYEGLGTSKKWERLETYGPKLVENIVQGIARDLLAQAMRRLRFLDIVMHIHDEIVVDAGPLTTLDGVCAIMAQTPKWAPGLLLRADGFEAEFYQKD